jgi:predicted nuclease of predicted toxin-antitoxin system
VRLLIDQNLPPRMARALADHYPGSLHVRDLDMAAAPDHLIWTYALEHGFTIASKDSDFRDLAFVSGPPPKVVWVRRGNCSTWEIEDMLFSNVMGLREFLGDPDAGLLALD